MVHYVLNTQQDGYFYQHIRGKERSHLYGGAIPSYQYLSQIYL